MPTTNKQFFLRTRNNDSNLIPKISCLSYCYNEYIRVIACTLFTPEIPKTYVWENYSLLAYQIEQPTISDCTPLETTKFPSNSVHIWNMPVCSLLTATDCFKNTMSYYSSRRESSIVLHMYPVMNVNTQTCPYLLMESSS